MDDDTKKGLIILGIGFIVALVFMLAIYGILETKPGTTVSSFYGLIFGLSFLGVFIGLIAALCYGASEGEWLVAGWVYLIMAIIFGIIGIFISNVV